MSLQYGKLSPTSVSDRFVGMERPQLISMGFGSWQRYCTDSSNGHQPNFAAFIRGRHLYSAGLPSRWALAQILVDVR